MTSAYHDVMVTTSKVSDDVGVKNDRRALGKTGSLKIQNYRQTCNLKAT